MSTESIKNLLIIMEGKKTRHQEILECITLPEYKKLYTEWHNIGSTLNEAAVTQDQINQIFAAIDAGARAGKNVDAPGGAATPAGSVPKRGVLGSISNSWLKFKDSISQSRPISGFDVAFDKLQGKVLSAAGGQSGTIGKALDKYKEFATKYPKMQGAIYGGLAILAGLSGWGLGATALLAGVRTLDRLLQGDRLSSALWKGFKAGATSYAVGQVAQGLGGGGAEAAQASPAVPGGAETIEYAVKQGDTLSQIAQNADVSVQELLKLNPEITNPNDLALGQHIQLPDATGSAVYQQGVGTASDTAAKVSSGQYTPSKYGIKESILDRKRMQKIWAIQESMNIPRLSSTYVTQYGIARIFTACERQNMINEGIWDSIKGAAKSGMDTLTNKITKDKLELFWRKNFAEYSQAESVDVDVVKDFLRRMGVKDGLTNQVLTDLKIPVGNTTPDNVEPEQDAGAGAYAAGAEEPEAGSDTGGAGAGAFGQMSNTLSGSNTSTSSTGGTTTQTPTGQVHTQKPPASAAVATEPAAPAAAAPTGDEEIELPGTNYKFKRTSQWMTDDGKVASDASAKVLNQLASGTSKADLEGRDLIGLRRQPFKGSASIMPESKKKVAESKKFKRK